MRAKILVAVAVLMVGVICAVGGPVVKVDKLKADEIRQLAAEGTICDVLGHKWEYTTPAQRSPFYCSPCERGDYSIVPWCVEEKPRVRVCLVCGRVEHLIETWERIESAKPKDFNLLGYTDLTAPETAFAITGTTDAITLDTRIFIDAIKELLKEGKR